MNRYLFRSLVAVLTFLLSIAVSAIIHPFGSKRWEHRYSNYAYHERHCPRAMAFARPALSIDAVATDPVKLLYSETRPQPYSSQQQITFLLDIQTTEPVSAVVVQHSSRWPEKDRWEVESVRVPYDPTRDAPPTVSLDCGSDQTLWVWISSIEFKDGARWINPRHSGEQSF